MQGTEFYKQILGHEESWFVANVKLDIEFQQVDVFFEHAESTTFEFPECGKPCAVYFHTGTCRWRHLDTMQFRTILHAQPLAKNAPNTESSTSLAMDREKQSIHDQWPFGKPERQGPAEHPANELRRNMAHP
ncbi:transposase family protein [Crateriforma spongiae]|uniref:transposase family protein n=1 Tax=Crateriforma spongiae TaxID=2724528 RepID=UPI00197FE37B|nr:transposase family protein [Crateriforma spongiae]